MPKASLPGLPLWLGDAGAFCNLGEYRFGFQSQEQDNEIYGTGNAVSYKYRVEDARLGRFLSVDPLAPKYPFYSPYAFSGNRVLDAVELEGAEPKYTRDGGIYYNVMKGQGPTQIANDLKLNGVFINWESIVQQNPQYFDHIQENKWEKSNSAYTRLNMNVEDELFIGTYSVSAVKPVENSGWQEANIDGVHIGAMELSGGYGVGASGALFRTHPIQNPNVWEYGRSLLIYSAGLQATTPGVDFNVGLGFMNFQQIKNSSVTETLTDAQSIGISFGRNYGIGGKALNITGYLPGMEALPVYARSQVYSINMGFIQFGSPGIGGSYSDSKFPLNFSNITVQPAIDSQKRAYEMHLDGNINGTKYLLDHKLDTAKTIK
ncbi:MAG: hypothetical protein R3D00_21410 [Bacteroidia bacterium]